MKHHNCRTCAKMYIDVNIIKDFNLITYMQHSNSAGYLSLLLGWRILLRDTARREGGLLEPSNES